MSEKGDAKLVKELREKSGAPMSRCLKALQESKGEMEESFRDPAQARHEHSAQKKASRTTNENLRGRHLHSRRRQDRRARRSELRERFSVCPHDGFPGAAQGHRDARTATGSALHPGRRCSR